MRDYCQIDRRSVMLGLCAALGPVLPAAAEGAIGRVDDVQALAFLDRAGDRLTAVAGGDVLLKDVAITGAQPSRLELRLGAATRIRLGSNAVFAVDRFIAGAAASTTLSDGAVLIDRGAGAERKFLVRTPFALLAARGTKFFAGPSRGAFGVFVEEGRLDVRTPTGQVTLASGQGTEILERGGPPAPVKNWSPERIAAALEQVS